MFFLIGVEAEPQIREIASGH
ncbi:hypothetical protein LINPERPRIM_LOCUS21023 [Linum perenne]